MSPEQAYPLIEKFYKEYRNRLVNETKKKVGSIYNAEDVVQEAFLRALTYCGTFDPDKGPFEEWFSRIIANAGKDFNKVERLHGMFEDIDQALNIPYKEIAFNTTLAKEVLREAEALPDLHKRVIIGFLVHGLSAIDIARVSNTTPGNARTILFRFREQIKEKFGKTINA